MTVPAATPGPTRWRETSEASTGQRPRLFARRRQIRARLNLTQWRKE